jgi:hypothetical protein
VDERSLAEPEFLSMDQTEIATWRALISDFEVELITRACAGDRLPKSQVEWEQLHFQNWAASTIEERNALANLALSDMFNPRNAGVIRHLIRRGLVSAEPPQRLLDEAFKSFILANADLESLSNWRQQGKDSLWSALWPTLLVIIGLLMFFVISAGQNTVRTALALLASIVAALPVLMSVFAVVRSNSSSGGNS